MKGFNRNRETRLRTSNKQYGRRDEEENRQKGMLNPDTADRYWRYITFISMGKTEINEYEIECASDLVEL